jgi:hypothetical protein
VVKAQEKFVWIKAGAQKLTLINWMMKKQFVKASIDDCLFYKEFKHNGKDVFNTL